MEEKKLDLEAARACYECAETKPLKDLWNCPSGRFDCIACRRNAARVGQALMAAWEEMPFTVWEKCHDIEVSTGKANIAHRHGLGV